MRLRTFMEKQLNFLVQAQHTDVVLSKTDVWTIYIDGAARGNPGLAGAGVYIKHQEDAPIREALFLGEKTNNQAEYIALAYGLFLVKKLLQKKETTTHNKNIELVIHSDSQLLIRQLNGQYKVKNEQLATIKKNIDAMRQGLKCLFVHVPREYNKEADALANLGIDKKKRIPTDFLNFLANCSFN